MFISTTLLLLLGTASALPAQQAPQANVVHHPTMGDGGDGSGGGETGDGPCYDAAKKTLDACLKAATAAGSSGAGQMCHDTYCVQVAACDASYGE